jgi:RNA polymerase sigma-32 factor
MAATTYPVLSGESGLSRYLNEIKAFPILSAEEEYMLAKRYLDYGETEAAHKLVTSHLRLVAKIAMQFRGYGLPVADLISEGNIGLMKAVKKFEPDRGFRLSTYSMWWIKASVNEYVLRSWSMVKLGTMTAQKKLFFSLRKAKRNLGIIDTSDLNPEQAEHLSENFGLSARDITNMNQRMMVRDLSLNAPLTTEEDSIEYMDTLVDGGPSPEAVAVDVEETDVRNSLLRDAMSGLDERERHIFRERRLNEERPTLEQLGKHFGVSRERIRQIEKRAYGKVEKAVRNAVAAKA